MISFGQPIYEDELTLSMRAPDAREVKFWAYVDIFLTDSWTCIAATMVGFVGGFVFTGHVTRKLNQAQSEIGLEKVQEAPQLAGLSN